MTPDLALRVAYAANILILVPVVTALFRTDSTAAVFGAGVAESVGLRLLVAALWSGILVCSVAGLFAPRLMMGVLVLQVIYKTIWLATYVWPAWRADGWSAAPQGPTLAFLVIVLVWPAILVWIWQQPPW